jgi:hypothetical protein
MMRKLTAAALLALLLPAPARATSPERAMKLDWTEPSRAVLQAAFPNVVAVNEFIQAVLPKPTDDNWLPLPLADQYMFADLNGDGRLELVVTRSDGGRFSSIVTVIAKGTEQFSIAEADDGGALDVPDLKDVIIDPDGTGPRALLLPRWLDIYPGAFPGPIFYDIYAYTAGRLVRADLRHAAYYRDVLLPRLAKQMAVVNTPAYDGPPAWRAAAFAAKKKAYDAMTEMLRTGRIPHK